MEKVPRYPLSVILSFLTETEGTSLLITKRRYAYQLLPVFQQKVDGFEGLSVQNVKRRHRFMPLPVQDPFTLLARSNTRRLYRRRTRPTPGLSTSALASREWGTSPRFSHELELLRFLSQGHELCKHTGTLLVSYPRSGNTLVRTLLERTTGIVTGSDTRPDRGLSRELAEQHSLVGEGISQPNLVSFVKTHWPERTGNAQYTGKRAVLLVRNPFDAIDSYWNMNATKSHTRSLADEVYNRFRDKFGRLVRNEIQIWIKFLDFWMTESGVPVLIVRFEDLVENTERELSRILRFSFQQAELSNAWQDRIRHAAKHEIDALGSYQPRSASRGVASIGKSLRKKRYSDDLLCYLHTSSQSHRVDYLKRFGYDVCTQGFPLNLKFGCYGDSNMEYRVADTSVQVNVGAPIRPVSCEFGRLLQQWRYSVTDTDRNPLPTV